MPTFGPVKREELLRCLRKCGFEGPFSGGKHQFMVKGGLSLVIPNPHRNEIGRELLGRILRQAGVTRKHWESL